MTRWFSQLILLICSLSAFSKTALNDTVIIGTVNSLPITLRELKMCEDKCKQKVIQEFKSRYNIPFDADFWGKTSLKPSPSEVLRERAFNAIVDIKIQQQLAQRLGLVTDISYKSFKIGLIAENNRRKKAASNHQIIYGPVQFSEVNYYDYLLSNLILKLKNRLAKDSFFISDSQLKTQYELNKVNVYKIPDSVCFQKVTIKSLSADTSIVQSQKLRKNAELVRERLLQNSFKLPGIKNNQHKNILIESDTLTLNSNQYQQLEGEVYIEISHKIKGLKTGKVSDVYKTANGYEIYKIISQKNMGFKAFETVRNSVFSAETDRLYAEFIHRLKEKAIIVQF